MKGHSLARLVGAAAAFLIGSALLPSLPGRAAAAPEAKVRDWSGRNPAAEQGPGAEVYRQACAACHDSGQQRAPQHRVLQDMTPRAIHRALTDGVMREQGAALSAEQRVAVAEFLTNRKLAPGDGTEGLKKCTGERAAFDFREPPAFAGWGLDLANSHRVSKADAGVDRANVGKLKLRWAFAFPDANRARSQPALAGGAILVGSHNGSVYALDRETGCLRWAFHADAEVRTAIVVSPWRAGDRKAQPLAYFGDVTGNAYAIDARSGALVWKITADDHPAATLTAAPTLYRDTLYVPVSSIEEASAAVPGYACCTFRGSILALDARTGRQKWRTYLAEEATVQSIGPDGRERLGPSGVAVWNSPSIDEKRGQLYIATSDNYSAPTTGLSDAILALDLATGAIRWHLQTLSGDMWNVDCFSRSSGACPDNPGPDFGFGAGTILAASSGGRELVLAGQKSGWAFAVDPDSGQLVWRKRVGRGGIGAGIYFGMATANGHLFVPVTDRSDGKDYGFPASPGLHALDIASGEFVWQAPAEDACHGKAGCDPGFGGAITATPDLVFAGADDGHMRIFDAATGAKLWDLDTTQAFPVVNGGSATGGAIGGGAAPIVHRGQVIVSSGYGYASKLAGNLLLVFGTD